MQNGDVAIRSPKCYELLKAIDKIGLLRDTDCQEVNCRKAARETTLGCASVSTGSQ